MDLEILFENSEIFILNKPPFSHSVKQRTTSGGLVIAHEIEKSIPGASKLSEAGLLHRLDFETSGCLAVAKSERAYQKYIPRFREAGEIQKLYWALVEKAPKEKAFDFYFSSRYRGSKKISVASRGKPAERGQCQMDVLESKNDITLLAVRILGGGKRHQIRAGLSKLGSPLIGDALYGGSPNFSHFFLHCRELKGADFEAIAPLPEVWKSAM